MPSPFSGSPNIKDIIRTNNQNIRTILEYTVDLFTVSKLNADF